MKKYLNLLFVLILVFSIGVNTASAQETKKPWEEKVGELRNKINTLRDDAKQKMMDLRAKIKEEKIPAKAKIKELRLTGREKALERFDAAILRVGSLKERVDAKITDLKGKGVDVTKAENSSKSAGEKLDNAKNKVAEINTLLAKSLEQLTQADKTKLRTLAQEIQTLIKGAHTDLRDAVKSLKDGVKLKLETNKQEKQNDDGNT